MQGALSEATSSNCGWTKGPAKDKETCWWNDEFQDSPSEKQKLSKEWKEGNITKKKYLEPKKKTRRNV